MLAKNEQSKEVDKPVDLGVIEAYMLSLPQIEVPVEHYFGPGVYVRSITMPKGAMCLGHEQRFEHLNIMLTGSVVMYDDGVAKVMTAPLIFTGKPGRKVGQVIEECTWLNIFATDETDIDKLEEMIANKSDYSRAHKKTLEEMTKSLEVQSCQS